MIKKCLKFIFNIYFLPIILSDTIRSYVKSNYYPKDHFHFLKLSLILFNKIKNKDDIFVDVGSANGDSVIIMNKYFPDVKIIAFEPLANMYNQLIQRTKELNNISIIQKAIADTKQISKIQITKSYNSSSLLKLNEKYNSRIEYKNELAYINEEEREVSTLDEELQQFPTIGLLKIDVQGAELLVLKGGIEILKKTKIVLLEMNNHDSYIESAKYFELDTFLRNNDFCLYDIIPSLKNNGAIYEWDSIYVKNNFLPS